jgi:hypothetical protein
METNREVASVVPATGVGFPSRTSGPAHQIRRRVRADAPPPQRPESLADIAAGEPLNWPPRVFPGL